MNALVAFGYIVLVVGVIWTGSQYAPKEDNILMPMAAISLFTLSAAVMGYTFGFQPALLFFDNERKQGVELFLKTVGVFSVITILVVVFSFNGLFA